MRGLNLGLFLGALFFCMPSIAAVVDSFEKVTVSKVGRYVFFLHGAIAEGTEGNPVSGRFGTYDFSGLKMALDSAAYVLIAERREKGVPLKEEANRLAGKVHKLIAAGVPPANIAVVGFSRGGGIVGAAMSVVGYVEVRYALLAACPKELAEHDWGAMSGQVFSMYERSDTWAGSCKLIAERSPKVSIFEEVSLDSGLGHGEFYRPRNTWLIPLLTWLQKDH